MPADRAAHGFRTLRRGARVVAIGVAVAAVALVASCRDVVSDDVVDAQAALCATFEACSVEDAACDRIRSFFAEGDDDVYDAYLQYYRTWSCGEGCGSLEACLDFAPLCGPERSECAADFECCNASTGAASCKRDHCCYDLGVGCEGPEDCCPLEDGTEVGCFARKADVPKTCGGFAQCALRDKECEVDGTPCCGKASCKGGVCVVDTCVARDAPCQAGEKCCVSGDECRDGACGPPPATCDDPEAAQNPPCCTVVNEACEIGGTPCCGGALCSVTLTGETLCGGEACGPLGSDCSTDQGCCPNGTDDIRCLGVGADDTGQRICQAIDCQLALDAPCNVDLPCCSGLSCLPSDDGDGATTCQAACGPKSCHDIRSFGPAFDPGQGCGHDDQLSCAAEVCEADAFCCCVLWDTSCVQAARECLGDENEPDPDDPNGSSGTGG